MITDNLAGKIKYKGLAIGFLFSILDPSITLFDTYAKSLEICENKEQSFRSSPEGKIFFENYINGIENPEIFNIYANGLAEGIEKGLKIKGLKKDESHLQMYKKSENTQVAFHSIKKFLNNKTKEQCLNELQLENGENAMEESEEGNEANEEDVVIVLASINLKLEMQNYRNAHYTTRKANEIITDLVKSGEIDNKLNEIYPEYTPYLLNWEIINHHCFALEPDGTEQEEQIIENDNPRLPLKYNSNINSIQNNIKNKGGH